MFKLDENLVSLIAIIQREFQQLNLRLGKYGKKINKQTTLPIRKTRGKYEMRPFKIQKYLGQYDDII